MTGPLGNFTDAALALAGVAFGMGGAGTPADSVASSDWRHDWDGRRAG